SFREPRLNISRSITLTSPEFRSDYDAPTKNRREQAQTVKRKKLGCDIKLQLS
ncbi:17155_t:CDS:1, partial [Gigaspora rosea]